MTVATPAATDPLHLEPTVPLEAGSYRFSPLVSWLVATVRPAMTVELGPGDRASLLATCGAVLRSASGARCAAVLLPSGPEGRVSSRAS